MRKYPSTFNQKQIWTFTQIAPKSRAYNIFFSTRISKGIDIEVLQKTFSKLVERHEILRTTLFEEQGELFQYVHEQMDLPFNVIDASAMSDAAIKAQAQVLKDKLYDLTTGPLMHVYLFKQSEQNGVLLLCAHHTVWDAWSFSVFIEEIDSIYAALKKEPQCVIAPLALQYKDLANWQQHFIQTSLGKKQLAYWEERLKPLKETGFSLPRAPFHNAYAGADGLSFKIDKTLMTRYGQWLQQTKQRAATLHMGLLAIFNLLLHYYSGQADVLISSPKPGRLRKDEYGVRQKDYYSNNLGYFVNPVLIATHFKGDETFRDYFNRVLVAEEQDRDNQDYPYIALVDKLKIKFSEINFNFLKKRPDSKFDTLPFIFDIPQHKLHLTHFTLEPYFISSQQQELFDIGLSFIEYDRELYGWLNYRLTILTQTEAHYFVQHFIQILHKVVQNPYIKINEIDILTAEEKYRLLYEFNNNLLVTYKAEQATIHQKLETQVKATPHAIAVQYDQQTLTYAELNNKANVVANVLRQQGVKPNHIVGVMLDPCPELIIGILGILKAGGAYLPLDPKYPLLRIQYLLADSKAQQVLTQTKYQQSLLDVGYTGASMDLQSLDLYQTCTNLINNNTPSDLAYIIYTSGSTGQPKGALLTHQNVLHYLNWAIDYYQVAAGVGAPLHSSIAFDLTVTSLFTPLLAGKTVFIIANGFEGLSNALVAQPHFSLVKLTPAHVRLLQHSLPPESITQLTGVFVIGGEALLAEDIRFLRTTAPRLRIVNEYGPTETTVGCCIYEVGAHSPLTGSLPIGRPIANTQLYVLNAYLNLVPIGVMGELYIRGDGVGRGYLHRAALTQEKFIADPFHSDPKRRLYKTGDQAMWSSDGLLYYLGRNDQQVKIRGYRIELGEIESLLNQQAFIQESIVLAREIAGQKKLVAYLVFRDKLLTEMEKQQRVNYLQSALQKALPDYMLPSYWVPIAKIPLNVHGKVERDALPLPQAVSNRALPLHTLPQSDTEKTLAKIWCELLRLTDVGREDNFFQLGGDSIISIQMVSRARQQGLIFTVKQIFDTPTIAGLARQAGQLSNEPKLAITEPAQDLAQGEVFLTPIQQGFFAQNFPNLHHYNQSQLLTIKAPLNVLALESTLRALVIHHDSLRLRFKKEGERWTQFYANPHALSDTHILSYYDLSQLAPTAAQASFEEIVNKIQAMLHIEQGPMVVAGLFDWGSQAAERYQLLLVIHHLIIDGVSWRILLEDLQTLYQQSMRGLAYQLPRKTYGYQAWAQALQHYATSPKLQGELDYWLKQVAHSESLPKDLLANTTQTSSLEVLHSTFDAAHTQQLLQHIHRAYRTKVDDILLTALALTLTQWVGKDKAYILLEGHGREDVIPGIDLSRTVGWFTAIFPMCLDLHGVTTLARAIKAIKEQCRQIPQHGIGYGILYYLATHPQAKELRQGCQPQVAFNYLGQWDNQAEHEQAFKPAALFYGQLSSTENKTSNLIEINAYSAKGNLQFLWLYQANALHKETLEKLVQAYNHNLKQLIQHCLSAENFGYTPSDFPYAKLTQAEIDTLFEKYPDVEDVYPTTPLQHVILARHYRQQSAVDEYFNQAIFNVAGDIDNSVLYQAWVHVLRQYAVFRTGFIVRALAETLHYVVHKNQFALAWKKLDWQTKTYAEQVLALQHLIQQERQQGFDMRKPPLCRFQFIQCSAKEAYLIWNYHHILIDGWSVPIILSAVLNLYQTIQTQQAVTMPSEIRPFRDYIVWLQQQDKKVALDFWREQLDGVTFANLSKWPMVPHDNAMDYACMDSLFSAAESERFRRLAKDFAVTPNILFQALWALLLSHYTHQQDVVFGVMVSGRPAEFAEVEQAVGLFMNTLPLRLKIMPHETLPAFLERIKEQMLKINRYFYVSVEDIANHIGDATQARLFDTVVIFENYPASNITQTPQFAITHTEWKERFEYPLTLQLLFKQQLLIRYNYQTRYFTEAFIKRLEGCIQAMLNTLIVKPTLTLQEISARLHKPVIAGNMPFWQQNKHAKSMQTDVAEWIIPPVNDRKIEAKL